MESLLITIKRLSGDYMEFTLIRELDFEDINTIKKLCEGYQNFVSWNKASFRYEIFNPSSICNEIYIAHNLWDQGEVCTSEEFIEGLNEVIDDYLHMYGDEPSEEEMEKFMEDLMSCNF